MRWLFGILGVLMLATMLRPAFAGGALEIEGAWIREAPPTATILAAFMVLRNLSAEPVDIVSVTSPRFGRVEVHQTRSEEGMVKMVRQERLTVPAEGHLELAPGGYHLMLFDPREPVRAGQRIALMLHTRDGREIAVDAEVRRATGMHGMQHHH